MVRWAEETVAFHESTASTHLFDEDTHRLVEALQRGGCAVTSAALWTSAFGDAPTSADCLDLDRRMEILLQTGLVTAISS